MTNKKLKKLAGQGIALARVSTFLRECGVLKYFNSVGELRKVKKLLKW